MKKILLTTILGLGVAFSNMFAFVDIKRTDIQSNLENYISQNPYILRNIYDQLRDECVIKGKKTIFKKETNNNSPLLVGLRRIIHDANHIYYCYNSIEGEFFFLVTKENVTLNDKFVITRPADYVPYIRFNFNTDNFKLSSYVTSRDNNDLSRAMQYTPLLTRILRN